MMSVLETIKDVVTLVQKADNLELVKQVLALQADIMKLMEENRDLKDEVRILKEQLNTKRNLSYRNGAYWTKKEDGSEEGPYCSVCQDNDNKMIRLKEGATKGHFFCQVCSIKAQSARRG